jgi:hypothetical protein
MLDYCLFTCLYANEIETYNFVGGFFEIHPLVSQVMQAKQIMQCDESDLIYIHNESYKFINFWIDHYLVAGQKWLFITTRDKDYQEILFKDIRFCAEDAFIIDGLIVLKNIKNSFRDFKRKDFNFPVLNRNIEDFFNLTIDNHDDSVDMIDINEAAYVVKILKSNSDFVYFGTNIQLIYSQIDKLKQLLHMNLKVLECRTFDNELLGYICEKDFVSKFLVFLGHQNNALHQYYKLNICKLIVPV